MMRKCFLAVAAVLILSGAVLLGSCGSTPRNSYPMPTPGSEQDVLHKLSLYLNSDKGHALTADQLAVLTNDDSTLCLNLPVNEDDDCPQFDVTYRDADGATLVFTKQTFEGDTINPIGTASLRRSSNDSLWTFRVHARGKGLYTFYNIRHQNCHCTHHDKHPDGFPEYEPCIVAVKPGGEELLLTWGHPQSERIFKK